MLNEEEVTYCYMVRESTDSGFFCKMPNEVIKDGDPMVASLWIVEEFGDDWIPVGFKTYNTVKDFIKERDSIDKEF